MGKSRFRKGEKWGKNKYANEMKKEKASDDAYYKEREELKAKVVELEKEYYQRYSKDELISLAIGNRDYEGCCVGYRDNEVIREDVMELKKEIPFYNRPDVSEWFNNTSLTTDDFTEEELLFLSKL